MRPARLFFFMAAFLVAGATETTDTALAQIFPCGTIGSNCYRAYCDNRVYRFECCNGTLLFYNSSDCWGSSSSPCVQSCWTQAIGTAHCPLAACGGDVFDKNSCFVEGCRSPVFRKRP